MFPLSKRNMNSNIDLTMICNKNHHIKMYDQKVKIVLFTVKIVKNFCTRLAWAFPEKNSIIRAYFDSRALQSSHSYWIPQRQRVREYYRSSRRKNESYNFYPKWVITKKSSWLFTGCRISMIRRPSHFFCLDLDYVRVAFLSRAQEDWG